MRLLAIGRLKGPEATLFADYAIRLRPALAVTEFPESRGSPNEATAREATALLSACTPKDFVVALDAEGESPTSPGLAMLLAKWRATNRPLTFLIGGPEGFATQVLARADATLSLGPLTWPHRLARVLLAEQLYRAQSIKAGHPYHRTHRP